LLHHFPTAKSLPVLGDIAKLWCLRKEEELWDLFFGEEQTSNEKLEYLVIGVLTVNRTIWLLETELLVSGVYTAV